MSAIDIKVCTVCGVAKSLSDFHRRARSRDGLMSQCKACVNARIRNNYAKDPAAKIAKTRQYHLDHPEWSKETLAEWHRAHRDERYQKVLDRLGSDPEFKDYRRDLTARHERARRAKKIATQFEQISKAQYDKILREHDNECWICGVHLDHPVWDHVQPLAKGGAHTVENLRPACGPCNIRKSATWPFTEDDQQRVAGEVRASRASRALALPDGAGV